MTMIFDITSVSRELSTGRVLVSFWTASKFEGTAMAHTYGSVALPENTAELYEFIPYDALDKAQVVLWTKNAIGENELASIEKKLDEQLSEAISPVQAVGTPW